MSGHYYPPEYIELLKEAIVIEDLVSGRIVSSGGKKKMVNCVSKGHDDKTASMAIDTSRNTACCFGGSCDMGGVSHDSINIAAYHYGYGSAAFPDKIAGILNDMPGLPRPPERKGISFNSIDRPLQLCDKITNHWHENLINGQCEGARKAMDYLIDERGFSIEEIKDWRIGFSPKTTGSDLKKLISSGLDDKFYWTDAIRAGLMRTKGIEATVTLEGKKEKVIVEAVSPKTVLMRVNYKQKVIKRSELNDADCEKWHSQLSGFGAYWAHFNDERIVFPVSDTRGRVRGFSARAIDDSYIEKKKGKYVNSPDCSIFHKSELMYGIEKLAPCEDSVILVEGQLDVIRLHSKGYKAIALMGTAADAEEKLKVLLRKTATITLALDGDTAGIKSTAAVGRNLLAVSNRDIYVDVAQIPEGEDPDTLLRSCPERFEKILEERKSFPQFYCDNLIKNNPVTGNNAFSDKNKLTVAKELADMLKHISNVPYREMWRGSFSRQLGLPAQCIQAQGESAPLNEISSAKQAQEAAWGSDPVSDLVRVLDRNESILRKEETLRTMAMNKKTLALSPNYEVLRELYSHTRRYGSSEGFPDMDISNDIKDRYMTLRCSPCDSRDDNQIVKQALAEIGNRQSAAHLEKLAKEIEVCQEKLPENSLKVIKESLEQLLENSASSSLSYSHRVIGSQIRR